MSEKTVIVDVHKINGQRPPFDIYIGRAVRYTEFTKNSKWYNPYYLQNQTNLANNLLYFENYIREKIRQDPLKYDLEELRGKRLGCWCIGKCGYVSTTEILPLVCHGQILLKLLHEREAAP